MSLIGTLPAELTGAEILQRLLDMGGRPPIGELMDQQFTAFGEGWAEFTGIPSPQHYNPIGTVHGGYLATLLDSACACAVQTLLPAGRVFTSLELKVAFLRPVTAETGPIVARGEIQSSGRRVSFAEARLTDGKGRLLATATSTVMVLER